MKLRITIDLGKMLEIGMDGEGQFISEGLRALFLALSEGDEVQSLMEIGAMEVEIEEQKKRKDT